MTEQESKFSCFLASLKNDDSYDAVTDRCEFYQRDGEFNPAADLVKDHEAYDNLTDYVYLATIAAVGTGNAELIARVDLAVRTWFVNTSSRMNPSLQYSQVRGGPNSTEGSESGVLDGKGLTKLVSAVQLLRTVGSPQWKKETDDGLMEWSKGMAEWLTTSELGQAEREAAK